jgi:1-acyl-sn-glycerol-3-phosphate acyltransferase
MGEKIKSYFRAITALFLVILNTFFWMVPLFAAGILKFLLPVPVLRKIFNGAITFVCNTWNSWNNHIIDWTQNIVWDVRGHENLKKDDSYLVLSNHQTWNDILVLEKIFINKIPFLKFFIKQELIWIPVLGFSWWALDYPFMKRYSKEFLEKNPHLRGKDLEATRAACEKFRETSVSVMNFVEGTRFTRAKHQKQGSPYRHLLRPKAGGTALVLDALGNQLQTILDVTIYYPQGAKTLWQFFCGEVESVIVRIEKIPVTDAVLGDYFNDPAFKARFQEWINTLWARKDATLSALSQHHQTTATRTETDTNTAN